MPKSLFPSMSNGLARLAGVLGRASIMLLPFAVVAGDNPLLYEPDKDVPFYEEGVEYQEVGPWREQKSALPPYPQDGDLIELPEGSAPDRFTYFIDEKNLLVSPDKVVHYTVVAESETGARNVFFEGIRCDEGMYKVYGYGTSDGKVSKMRNPSWKYVATSRVQRYRRDLHAYFLCDSYGFPLTKEEAVRALETGDISGVSRGGFLGGDKAGW